MCWPITWYSYLDTQGILCNKDRIWKLKIDHYFMTKIVVPTANEEGVWKLTQQRWQWLGWEACVIAMAMMLSFSPVPLPPSPGLWAACKGGRWLQAWVKAERRLLAGAKAVPAAREGRPSLTWIFLHRASSIIIMYSLLIKKKTMEVDMYSLAVSIIAHKPLQTLIWEKKEYSSVFQRGEKATIRCFLQGKWKTIRDSKGQNH